MKLPQGKAPQQILQSGGGWDLKFRKELPPPGTQAGELLGDPHRFAQVRRIENIVIVYEDDELALHLGDSTQAGGSGQARVHGQYGRLDARKDQRGFGADFEMHCRSGATPTLSLVGTALSRPLTLVRGNPNEGCEYR